ncbi:class I SAM-dependent methyltransferase [Thiobacillus thioparus]|uniref:class I SAM-dependent methyltransferase n=1 Tax=Thiobacillus thioparus TaxID=931 RepID=UPI00036D16B0|nr:class I SAM-dependent methyltransferase [Thiobacillus thioparus]
MEKNYEALNLTQPESEHDPFTEDRYRQFYKFLPTGTRSVLDIGCNTGRGGSVLKDLDNNLLIYGLDAVRDRLDRLPKDVYEQGVHGYSTKIPNEDGTYDAVVAGEFIEHLYQTDIDQTLGEIFRVLKIGGRLMLTTPNPYDLKRKWRGHSILGGAHVSQHFPDTLRIKLRMSGFSNVKIYGSGKVSRYLGMRFPMLSIYGSYLAIADKK